MRRLMTRAAFCLVLLAISLPALAQSDLRHSQRLRQEATALSHSLMSPYCPGRLLSDCPSFGAFELREEIQKRLDAGETSKAIVDDLAYRFGPEIRGVPEFKGDGIALRVVPIVVGVLALLVVGITVSRMVRRDPAGDSEGTGLPPEDREEAARLDDALHALD